MTLGEAKNDILRKIWIEHPDSAPSWAVTDVFHALNQAFQHLWQFGPAYFRRADYSFSTVIGTSSYELAQGVQEVFGPIRLNGGAIHLRAVADRSNFDFYHIRFKGETSEPASNGTPEVYHLDRKRQTEPTETDLAKINLLLKPTPSAVWTVDYEASVEAPSYAATDADSTELRMPHNAVESTLLPVARYFVQASHLFSNEETRGTLEQGYLSAMRGIGILDPQLPEVARDHPEARKGGQAA